MSERDMFISKSMFIAENVYSACMKHEEENNTYMCGFYDGEIVLLHDLGLISDEEYDTYFSKRFPWKSGRVG